MFLKSVFVYSLDKVLVRYFDFYTNCLAALRRRGFEEINRIRDSYSIFKRKICNLLFFLLFVEAALL